MLADSSYSASYMKLQGTKQGRIYQWHTPNHYIYKYISHRFHRVLHVI